MADDTFRTTLGAALEHSLAHLDNLDSTPVGATASLATLRARLGRPLADEGVGAAQVIADLARDVEGGIIGSAGGRFYAWVVGGALPAALAADWLTAAWDQNAGLYASGPAAAVVEEAAGAWIKDLLGLPSQASFALVTGCQMAHVTCLAAARYALLARRGWDVALKGLYGAPHIRLITTREGHGSVDRAIRLLGLGRQQVVELPTDAEGRMRVDALEQAFVADPAAPTIVLLQAGDVNIGAFDRFKAIIPVARRHPAWVHVDGAIGLWAAVSPRYRHLLEGVGQADSWATDGHKWLNVPYDCGYAFVADAESHRASMSHRAPYLTHDDQARDQMDWNPEWSRRARGFPTYAALRELGRQGIADLVERCCAHAHALVTRIGALPGAEVLWTPVINQGLVRFTDDRRTDEVIAAVMATGEAFFGGTTWRGMRAMRVSVSNWRTSEGDLERAVRAIARVLDEGRTS
ncbi:MAG: pyridoxal-dependent decarboxylase [Acidobacteriota bacterium]|nr:pyridoxal-dependent decarboxylase [Acidobacteriota bacterium]